MSLQLGKCIVHRSFISPEDKVGTRIRFQTSMWNFVNGARVPLIRTFEATLRDISTQRNLDEGDPQYGFTLDETSDCASIVTMLREKYEESGKQSLAEWADDHNMLSMVQHLVAEPPVFRLETSAKYIFAEGDRVTVNVPTTSTYSISEPLGHIVELEIIN